MRIIGIAKVRNEADIIEAFVRHYSRICSHMIIVVHRSLDNTMQILERLRAEGISLEIRTDTRAAHRHGEVMTELLQDVLSEADWILPLDADEFLQTEDGRSPVEVIRDLPMDSVYEIPWKTYLPSDYAISVQPYFKPKFNERLRKEHVQFSKVLIPTKLLQNGRYGITEGNHHVEDEAGNRLPGKKPDQLFFAHVPVRSESQLRSKILGGWLSHEATAYRKTDQAFHWKRLFERCNDDMRISGEELLRIAAGYLAPEGYVFTSADIEASVLELDANTYEVAAADPEEVYRDSIGG
jgi:hypothetical protein